MMHQLKAFILDSKGLVTEWNKKNSGAKDYYNFHFMAPDFKAGKDVFLTKVSFLKENIF